MKSILEQINKKVNEHYFYFRKMPDMIFLGYIEIDLFIREVRLPYITYSEDKNTMFYDGIEIFFVPVKNLIAVRKEDIHFWEFGKYI
jgi:hypothetical protein